jgi:CheY-like chemotaxis protein
VKHPKASAPTIADMWEVLDRQVGNLTRLVDDLLDVARVTRGQIEMRKTMIDLISVVRQAIRSTELVVTGRAQTLELSGVPDGPLYVEADATRLEQVLGNLLNNASKFNREGGHIWVTVEAEPGGDENPAEWAIVRVRDDGLGIDPAMLPRVFDLFAQADQSLARPRGGLGIGLTIVRRVIEQHGGRVEARSEGLGHGSEFIVRIPLARVPESRVAPGTPAPSAPPELEAAARRVLVVDDSQDGADTLARLLCADGHEVRTAADGPSALAAVAAFRPDVVLLDISLPGMDGYELAEQIRQAPEMRSAVLVALTGYGQDRDRKRARQAGFDQHLTKPVDHARLRQVLRSRKGSS